MSTPLRVGDAERDAAAAALGEHYAAGRLTKDEYDERLDKAWAARFTSDLAPLFADLPRAGGPGGAVAPYAGSPVRARRTLHRPHPALWAMPLLWLVPLALFALIAVVVITGAPWLLFMLFWFWVFAGFGGRRWHRGARTGHRSGAWT